MGKLANYHKQRSQQEVRTASGLLVDNWTARDRPSTPEYRPPLGYVVTRPEPNVAARDQTRINWPYPPANYQVQNLNGWTGNQLPSSLLRPWSPGYVPLFRVASVQKENRQWTPAYGKQLSQIESANVLKSISQAWQKVRSS